MSQVIHTTVPVLVWADIDEGIAEMVRYLNTISGVRTFTSCQGTMGDGGPFEYPAYVTAGWHDDATLARLQAEFDVEVLGDRWGKVHPKAQPGEA